MRNPLLFFLWVRGDISLPYLFAFHSLFQCRDCRARRVTGCFYCGEEGHFARQCSVPASKGLGDRTKPGFGRVVPTGSFRDSSLIVMSSPHLAPQKTIYPNLPRREDSDSERSRYRSRSRSRHRDRSESHRRDESATARSERSYRDDRDVNRRSNIAPRPNTPREGSRGRGSNGATRQSSRESRREDSDKGRRPRSRPRRTSGRERSYSPDRERFSRSRVNRSPPRYCEYPDPREGGKGLSPYPAYQPYLEQQQQQHQQAPAQHAPPPPQQPVRDDGRQLSYYTGTPSTWGNPYPSNQPSLATAPYDSSRQSASSSSWQMSSQPASYAPFPVYPSSLSLGEHNPFVHATSTSVPSQYNPNSVATTTTSQNMNISDIQRLLEVVKSNPSLSAPPFAVPADSSR